MAKTDFQVFLDQEVNKVKGVYYPVKAGFPRRLLIKRASCKKLHPNPEDEFFSFRRSGRTMKSSRVM